LRALTAIILTFNRIATAKASGNVDSEGLIRREREAHRLGFRRATIFRRPESKPT
jgi:hypothetical protein